MIYMEYYCVNARDLHLKLGIKTKFIDWIKRKTQTLQENIHFTQKYINLPSPHFGRQIEYFLTKKTAILVIQKTHNVNYKIKETLLLSLGEKSSIETKLEDEFYSCLYEILNGMNIKIIRQYKLNNYKIDFFLPEYSLAIEYDEMHHNSNAHTCQDVKRQEIINKTKNNINFIRVYAKNSHLYNCGVVIRKIQY